MEEKLFDVIIIGSGPAGLTAALYTTRANLKTLVVAGGKWGGQLMLTTLVENYPGFPEGIQGPDLMIAMRKQAEKFGTQIVEEDFIEGDFGNTPLVVKTSSNSYQSKTVIIATGADTKWLDVPGEKEKIGRGVSSCAPCDAAFFRNLDVIVVGGGDSAMEEASVLSKFATSVTIVYRGDTLRASYIMQDRAKKNEKISFIFNSEVVEVLGEEKVTGVKIKNNKTNETSEMSVQGVFVAIGHMPNTSPFKGVDLDELGFIKVYDHTKTNLERVYVAGDVHDAHYKQAVTAAAFGCMAALDLEKFLREQE